MNLLLPAKSLKTAKKASGLDEKSNVALRVLIKADSVEKAGAGAATKEWQINW